MIPDTVGEPMGTLYVGAYGKIGKPFHGCVSLVKFWKGAIADFLNENMCLTVHLHSNEDTILLGCWPLSKDQIKTNITNDGGKHGSNENEMFSNLVSRSNLLILQMRKLSNCIFNKNIYHRKREMKHRTFQI